jgi:hypothetical protein
MKPAGTDYPDVSAILARKDAGRREIARRSFGDKIAMVEQLRERLAPLKKGRELRIAAKAVRPVSADPRR